MLSPLSWYTPTPAKLALPLGHFLGKLCHKVDAMEETMTALISFEPFDIFKAFSESHNLVERDDQLHSLIPQFDMLPSHLVLQSSQLLACPSVSHKSHSLVSTLFIIAIWFRGSHQLIGMAFPARR